MARAPSFIDRVDLSEDAEGRVAIFTVEPHPDLPSPAAAPRRAAGATAPVRRGIVALLDSRFAAPVFAVALVLLLLLGMLLTR